MPLAVVRPAEVVSSSLPLPSHPLGIHNSLSRCTDFRWHCRLPVLTCLQRMYNTIGGNAPPVRAYLAPYGGPGVVRPLAYPSLPPVPQVWCSFTSLSAPLAPVQVCCAVLIGSCRLLGALGDVWWVLFWSAALRGPANPIPPAQ